MTVDITKGELARSGMLASAVLGRTLRRKLQRDLQLTLSARVLVTFPKLPISRHQVDPSSHGLAS